MNPFPLAGGRPGWGASLRKDHAMASSTPVPGALAPYRVLEFASRRAAYCGKLLAGLGADVVLIEPYPDSSGYPGDASRMTPPFAGGLPGPERSLFFAYMNAGKRGVTLDLRTDAGQRRLLALARDADAVVDPFDPGYLDGLGVGYAALSRENPGLVLTSVTGFGQTGPHRNLKTSDIVAYAMGGLMSLNGYAETPPLEPAGEPAHILGGLNAACATAMALYDRAFTGRGRHVDISLQESVVQLTNWTGVGVYLYDKQLRTRASVPPGSTPIGNFPCQDGYISIQIARPAHWETLAAWMAEAAGIQEALDPALRGPAMRRLAKVEAINGWMRSLCGRYTKRQFVEEAQRRRLPAAPVSDPKDLATDPQLESRRYWTQSEVAGRPVQTPGAPFRMSRTPWRAGQRAPRAGEDDSGLAPRGVPGGAGSRPAHGRPYAFAGVRVVELSTGIGGPYLARILAHHGAEVIKVETTARPENIRMFVPSYDPKTPPMTDMHPGLHEWHAGKLHLGLDLGKPDGPGVLRRLLAVSDALLINYSAGAVEKMGLSPEAVRAVNPNLIWLGMFGYGDSGPYRDYLAWGPQIEATAGIAHLTAVPGGLPSRGVFYPDYIAAFCGLLALAAALDHRARTGQAQAIDLSMLEATVSTMGPIVLDQTVNGRTQQPLGNRSLDAAPHGCYPCAGYPDLSGPDRWIAIAVESDEQWRALCRAMGQPALADDGRFRDLASRLTNRDALDAAVAAWTKARAPRDAMDTLQQAGVPAGVVQTVADLVERDEHLKSRGYLMEMEHPKRGHVYGTGLAIRLGEPPKSARRTGVNVGHDNAYLLAEVLALPAGEIGRLEAAGVVERQ